MRDCRPANMRIASLLFRMAVPGSMDNSAFVILVYGPTYAYLLIKGINRWEKYQFRYSIEWFLAGVSNKRSEKEDFMHVNDIVYLPGFKRRDLETGKIAELSADEIKTMDVPFATSNAYKKISPFRPNKVRIIPKE